MYIDSHCHINFPELNQKIDVVLNNMESNKISHALCVSVTLDKIDEILDLTRKYSNIYASVGVHPDYEDIEEPNIDILFKHSINEKVVAIGETGLDYFHVRKNEADWQRDRFRRHIAASNKSGKPMIIHMRDSKDDTIDILSSEKAQKGVMHCFAEDLETAKAALDLGFYISFSGILTFKSAQDLREVAKQIPDDRILIETDSPYLTPVPYRGKPNSPAYTYYVAEKLAEIRNTTIGEIAKLTTQNFNQLFFS